MQSRGVAPVCRVFFSAVCLSSLVNFAFGAPPVLRWDSSAAGNVWNTTATNWLDADAKAVAWIPGAEARFEGSAGGLVQIAENISATNLTFTGNGFTLVGAGGLSVEGDISLEAAVTNCIAADLRTVGGLSKTGAGTLSLARCGGPFSVQAGTLLASGSLFADADLSVASGATLVTLGEPATNANLIANGSFELPAMASGAYQYVAGGNVISNWSVAAYPEMVARQNTAVGNAWNSAGASPDGVHMLILQYGGIVAQTVSIPADGLYSIAFSYLRRQNDDEHQVYVWLDGLPLATFLNRSVQFAPGRFVSGALWLTAGSHTLRIGGEHSWDDRSTMVDAVCFGQPSSGSACRAFGGDSVLNVMAGASVRLNHTGTVPLAYVSTNAVPVSGVFNAAHASGLFSGSGALACAAPGNVYSWAGAGLWSEAARWADAAAPAAGGGQNLLMRFPAAAGAAATNDLAGAFLTCGLWMSGLAADGAAALAGNAVVLTNRSDGTAPRILLQAPGTWTVASPVEARSTLTLETGGDLTFSGHTLGIASNATFNKTGPGTVTFPSFTNRVAAALIYEGTVQTPQLPSGLAVNLLTQTGKRAALCLTEGGVSFGNRITLRGSGTPALITRCGGGTLTDTDWIQAHGDIALLDVGAGDTLSLRQILLFYGSSGARVSATVLLKTGPGTLELRSGGSDTGENRAYRGQTVLRNGTLKLSEDDWGILSGVTNPFNGRTYSGTGGSLGYNPFTNAVVVGDSGTAASDDLALIANGDKRWIGHDIEVFNRGNTVALGMTAGTVMFAGTLTLHRDIILSAPADGVMAFTNVVFAGDYAGSGGPAFSGLGKLRIEGAYPSDGALDMGARGLSFGTYSIRNQTLKSLSLGTPAASAALDVDFGAGVNDTIAVTQAGGLTLSNTVVNLYYAGTGLPFAEPGTYTLFTYGGTLNGDAARLSVGNSQGVSYVFADDAANHRVTLTISGTAGGIGAVWTNRVSGDWGVGGNWDSGNVPSGAGVVPLFGSAITNAATVDTGAGFTVGGLVFNNAGCGYTLTGGGLTLATNGATPLVSVLAGTHTLDTTLSGADGFAVSAAAGSLLVLGPGAVADTGLTLSQGTVELRGNAAVNGATTLAAATLLRASGTSNAAVGTLSGPASSAVALTGTAPKLTVSQAADGIFAGSLSGASAAQVVKSGTGKLTLNNPLSTFAGQFKVDAGTLDLQGVALAAPVDVGASGTLAVSAPATNGLMGYYYSVTPNTNNFWTFSGMESHFATLTPNLAQLSGATSNVFDFGLGSAFNFPAPYGSGGSRSSNFEAVWRGTIALPKSGTYLFGVCCDDGFALAVDGRQLMARNYSSSAWAECEITLDAGRYDIVLGYFQLNGNGGIRMRVRLPNETTPIAVPSAWLQPDVLTGKLNGFGSLALQDAGSRLRTVQSAGLAAFSGPFSSPAGGLLTKNGNGILALSGSGAANAFAGDIDVQGGLLSLDADERVADASTLRVRAGATLAVAASETVGALSGVGALSVGGYLYTAPVTGDADCGVSPSKTYTHLLDFGNGAASAVINGVSFTKVSSSAGTGYSGAPGGVHSGGNAWNIGVPASQGLYNLLNDFNYGQSNGTLHITGLTPGACYELRLYHRCWQYPLSRRVQFTFDPDGAGPVSDSIAISIDAVAPNDHILGYRYVAASGELTVNYLALTADTYHLYGLSNEKIAGATDPALTLAPAAGVAFGFSGAVTGSGALVKRGGGTQRFSGTNSLARPLSVEEGTVVLESGATVSAGAAVSAGATLASPAGGVTLGGLTGAGVFSLEGGSRYPTNTAPYFVTFTNDAGSGISAGKVYTHKLDFGPNAGAAVNGVAFTKTTATNGVAGAYAWTNMPPQNTGGRPESIGLTSDNGMYYLLSDMNYNLPSGETILLTGLTPGKYYEVRLYNRTWDPNCNRTSTLTFDPDGAGPISHAITYDFDVSGAPPNYLGYRYLAATNTLRIRITRSVGDSYHLYALTNEESGDGVPGATTLALADDRIFDGTVTGCGPLIKSGAGSFTVTGVGDATGPLTVSAGPCGVASGGRITTGPVSVASGATLFGHGQMGGNVSVASNAWLMAGTAAACGTLAVGGDLTLAPGALPVFRFDAADVHDTFTVAGRLTFPTNGTLRVSALTTGVSAPAKALFIGTEQTINGPADLTGWTVEGVENCLLRYSDDRTEIYFYHPCGTLIMLE